jgi:uncharacterized protein YbbC (DUF1343 family)
MSAMLIRSFILIVTIFTLCATPKPKDVQNTASNTSIKTGAEQTEKFLPLLKGKRVAIMANPTTWNKYCKNIWS